MHFLKTIPVAACLIVVTTTAAGDDWPQWMGPTRDGEYRETGLVDKFPEGGPAVLWRVPIAGGYAGPAVADGRVFVFDYATESGEASNNPNERSARDGRERLHCLDQATGDELWQHSYDCPYSISYPAGPRCTPTVDGDRVYTLGSEGDLVCFQTETGEVLWRTSFKRDLAAEVPMWGFSAHPLVEGDLLICMVGGPEQTVVAFDKRTGDIRWKALTAPAVGYCPPSIVEAAGQRQLIVWHSAAIESLNPLDGSVFWTVPLEPAYEMAVARPQRSGNRLYASGIGNKAVMLRLKEGAPDVEELWSGDPKNAVYCTISTPIFYKDTIYGADCGLGVMRAVDAEQGDRLWETFEPTRLGETRRISHGNAFITHLVDSDRYLLMSELGDLIIAEMTPEGYHEISRAHVIEPTGDAFGRSVLWSHPAYADRTAYVRNDKEIIAVSLH